MSELILVGKKELQALVEFREAIFDLMYLFENHNEEVYKKFLLTCLDYKIKLKEWRNEIER